MVSFKKQMSTMIMVATAALFVFSGCVKKHKKRVEGNVEGIYALQELNSSPQNMKTINGDSIENFINGTYFVDTDFTGCESTEKKLGEFTDKGKIVVSLSNGKEAACVDPAKAVVSLDKDTVTFYQAPKSTGYKLYTKQVVRLSDRTQSPSGVRVDGEIGIKVLDIVEFTTNSPLLNIAKENIDLRALPNKEYDIYHKITPSQMFIMMVVPESEMSHVDKPIADNFGNGMFAIPLAAVDITLSNYRYRKNDDGQTSNVVELYNVNSLKTATHIRLDVNAVNAISIPREIYRDLYPRDYFTKSQWYVSESVVDTRPGSEGFIGTSTGSFDSDIQEASRVLFSISNSQMVACNIGRDERFIRDKTCSKSATVLSIPASGRAFTLSARSSQITLHEVNGNEAPFVGLNFQSATSTRKEIDKLFSGVFGLFASDESDQLTELSFAEDKFSFIIKRGIDGLQVMYSFERVDENSNYQARRHFRDDRENRFGYFVTPKEKYRTTEEVEREEDLEKDYFAQRHDPNKNIYFYFSCLTPDYQNKTKNYSSCIEDKIKLGDRTLVDDPHKTGIDYRDLGRKAVDYWNRAFEKAGAKSKVILVENVDGKPFDAPYGDITFNTINLIDSVAGSNLLGVGPSLTDPFTGEIINTNANVYIAPFRSIVAREVRDYIKSQLGYYEGPSSDLPASALSNSTLLGDIANSLSGAKNFISSALPTEALDMVANFYHYGISSFTTARPNLDDFSRNSDLIANLYDVSEFNSSNSKVKTLVELAKRVPEMRYLEKNERLTFNIKTKKQLVNLEKAFQAHRPTFYRSYFQSDMASGFNELNSLTRQIKAECGQVAQLIARVQARTPEGVVPEITSEEELPAVRDCMSKIVPDKLLSTLVHEMGHNLGLRHNFLGSTDKANFFTKAEVKEIYGLDVREEDLPRSSTTMEYVRTEQDRLTYPGHYDIAAIRYAYANKVEVDSEAVRPNTDQGVYVSLSKAAKGKSNGSIADELESKGQALRDFKYCTDIAATLAVDPMCSRHDFGVEPKDVVEDSINAFWENFVRSSFRYDRVNVGVTGPFRRAGRLDKLKRMYNEWRVELANELGKTDTTGNQYLQRYNVESYAQLLDSLRAPEGTLESEKTKLQKYLEIRERIFDFVLEVAFFPNHYCLTQTPAGLKAFEFNTLRNELKNQVPSGTQITSCEHPEMQQVIARKGYEYVLEGGTSVDNLWSFVNPQDTFKEDVEFRSFRAPLDQVGTFLDRFFASQLLASRQSGFTGLLENMFPNMLDEPDLYARFEEKILGRILQGVDMKHVIERPNDIQLGEDQQVFLPNFNVEDGLIKSLWLTYEFGGLNQFVDSSARASRFTRNITDNPDVINEANQSGAFILPLTSGRTMIVRRDAEVAFALGQGMNSIAQRFQATRIEVPKAETLHESIKPLAEAMVEVVPQDVQSLSVEQYLGFARGLIATFAQLNPAQQQLVQSLYISDMMLYLVRLQAADTAIQQAQAAEQQPPAQAVADFEAVVAAWTANGLAAEAEKLQAELAQAGQNVQVTLPTKSSVIGKYVQLGPQVSTQIATQLAQQKAQADAILEVHGDELFAQYNLIRTILLRDFGSFGEDINLKITELLSDTAINNLLISGRQDARLYIEKHLSPVAVAKKHLGLELPFEKYISSKKY